MLLEREKKEEPVYVVFDYVPLLDLVVDRYSFAIHSNAPFFNKGLLQ